MPAARVARHDDMIDDLDTEDAPGCHQMRRRRDILLARARISARVTVSQNYARRASLNGCPEHRSRLEGADAMLPSNRDDVRTRDVVIAI